MVCASLAGRYFVIASGRPRRSVYCELRLTVDLIFRVRDLRRGSTIAHICLIESDNTATSYIIILFTRRRQRVHISSTTRLIIRISNSPCPAHASCVHNCIRIIVCPFLYVCVRCVCVFRVRFVDLRQVGAVRAPR